LVCCASGRRQFRTLLLWRRRCFGCPGWLPLEELLELSLPSKGHHHRGAASAAGAADCGGCPLHLGPEPLKEGLPPGVKVLRLKLGALGACGRMWGFGRGQRYSQRLFGKLPQFHSHKGAAPRILLETLRAAPGAPLPTSVNPTPASWGIKPSSSAPLQPKIRDLPSQGKQAAAHAQPRVNLDPAVLGEVHATSWRTLHSSKKEQEK
jgi:hypothetical protein